MKRLYFISISGMFLLGVIHCLLALWIYPSLTLDCFWFVGTGIGLLAIALSNYIYLKTGSKATFYPLLALNVIMLLFASLLAIKFHHIPATLVATASLLLSVGSISSYRNMRR